MIEEHIVENIRQKDQLREILFDDKIEIEVILSKHGEHYSRASCDLENDLLTARQLWDDNTSGIQGEHRTTTLYFLVNGVTIRTLDKRP